MRLKIVNIGMIISFFINFIISLVFMAVFFVDEYLLYTFLLFAVFIGVSFTPIADWYYRNVVIETREMTPREYQYVQPVIDYVYRKAKQKVPELSDKIEFFVEDNDDINACAIGLRTIVLNSGLIYNCSQEEIGAIIGHEVAHIANGDTLCTLLAIQSNTIVVILRTIFMFLLKLVAIVAGFILGTVMGYDDSSNAEAGFEIGHGLMSLINMGISKASAAFMWVSVMIAQVSRRANELEADLFSAELGYTDPLIQFFKRFNSGNGGSGMSIKALLQGTHPSMEKRIQNLYDYKNNNYSRIA